MACDRMLRCSHDVEYYRNSFSYGYIDFPDEKFFTDTLRYEDFPMPKTAVLKRHPLRNDTLLFINHLINNEDFDAALLEIERQTYFNGLMPTLFKQKLICYEAQRRFDKAIYEFEILKDSDVKQSAEVRLHAAKIYDYAGITDSALLVLPNNNNYHQDRILWRRDCWSCRARDTNRAARQICGNRQAASATDGCTTARRRLSQL